MEQSAKSVLAECFQSWRRGPYPESTSFVSAVSIATEGECRWISDVNNIVDLGNAMQVLTYRQSEVLYRYIVLGQERRVIAGIMDLSERAVGIELEITCKELLEALKV